MLEHKQKTFFFVENTFNPPICHKGRKNYWQVNWADWWTQQTVSLRKDPFFFLFSLSKHTPKQRPTPQLSRTGRVTLSNNERQALSCHQLFLGPKAPAEEPSHRRWRDRQRQRRRERDGSRSNYQPCQGDERGRGKGRKKGTFAPPHLSLISDSPFDFLSSSVLIPLCPPSVFSWLLFVVLSSFSPSSLPFKPKRRLKQHDDRLTQPLFTPPWYGT